MATEFHAVQAFSRRWRAGVAFVSSPRASGVAAHFQKLSLDVVDVGGSGGCVWALGRLGLQCFGVACASGRACVSVRIQSSLTASYTSVHARLSRFTQCGGTPSSVVDVAL